MFQRYYSFTSKTCRMCTARTRQAYSLSAKMSSSASNLTPSTYASAEKNLLRRAVLDGGAYKSQRPRVNSPHILLTLCNFEGCSVQRARKESDRTERRLGSPLNEIDSVAWPLRDVQSKSWAETDGEAWRPAPAACSTAQ